MSAATTELVLFASIVLQLATVVVALRAPSSLQGRNGWRLIGVALVLMTIRRVVTLVRVIAGDGTYLPDPVAELVALAISALMLVGVWQVALLLRNAEAAREEAETTREALSVAEQLWRRVFEYAPEGHALIAADGTVHTVNRVMCRLLGMERGELEGRKVSELVRILDDGPRRVRDATARLMRGESAPSEEYRIVRPDGAELCVEVASFPIEHEGLTLGLTMTRDITAQRATEDELRRSRIRLEEAQQVAGLATWEFETATEQLWTSTPVDPPARVEEFGGVMSLDDAYRLVDEADVAGLRAAVGDVMSGATSTLSLEYRQQSQTGDPQTVRTLARSRRDADGNVVALIGATLDVTEYRAAEAKIRDLNSDLERRVRERTAELERAVHELEAFSYSVSHDLRAPLRSIAGYADAISEDSGDALGEREREYLDRLRHAAVRMGGMIDALLSLARLTRVEPHSEEVDISALANAVVDELRAREGDDHAPAVRIQPGLRARGDSEMLGVAMDNLLSNAWKFSRDRDSPEIEVGGREDGTLFVRDNGVGFDGSQAQKIFRPFERLHDEVAYEGNGIGLATVDRIIRRHGGRIWAESRPDEGATFYFKLES